MVIYRFLYEIPHIYTFKTVYIVTDDLANAEILFRRNYSSNKIKQIELISDKVINLWAQ